MFLSTGLVTILTAPFVYWKLENDVQTASFLAESEQAMAIERLRANQASSDSREVRWCQVKETFEDTKTWIFVIMSLGNSIGSQVPYTFGPLILTRLGYDNYTTLLLNIPFGALQYIVILAVSWSAMRFRWKSLTLGSSLVPVITGLVVLFVLPRDSTNTAVLLVGYHLFSFTFGCNSLILSWMIANTAGQTKKSITLSFYSAASSTGSIVGPLLFRYGDAPRYEFALKITLGVYIGVLWAVIIQVVNLALLNRAQEKKRVAHEKQAKLYDHSMDEKYVDIAENNHSYVGNFAFADLTDKQNDEFVYVY
ncbi:putative major facilitator superfamily transporter [Diaporthe ampelina]|uniref:Putative major facilitator superfamily transporter n=1 Tax=Diaporthe ampelina TaxID=1214573 RepID=A0A0G2HVK1_9PEZI|nr:putative major facilitator superfamily transporter [Diaporthe ampelina]